MIKLIENKCPICDSDLIESIRYLKDCAHCDRYSVYCGYLPHVSHFYFWENNRIIATIGYSNANGKINQFISFGYLLGGIDISNEDFSSIEDMEIFVKAMVLFQ